MIPFLPAVCMAPLVVPQFIGGTNRSGSDGALTWPSGTRVGDIGFALVLSSNATPITWSGATQLFKFANAVAGAAPRGHLMWKRLTAGDLSSPPTAAGLVLGAAFAIVYRGGQSVALKAGPTTFTGSTGTLTGFTKGGNSKKIIAMTMDRTSAAATTAASGFTRQYEQQAGSFQSSAWLDIRSNSYTNGTNINLTGMDSGFQGSGSGAALGIS